MSGAQGPAPPVDIFKQAQIREIQRVIVATIEVEGSRTSKELTFSQEAIVEASQPLYAQTTQFKVEQENMKQKMKPFNQCKNAVTE